jgi:hypothetical protein
MAELLTDATRAAHAPPYSRTHLRQVRADLALGNEHLSSQRQIVADLEQSGHDATIAKARLQEAEETQAVYVAEANRLERELAALT